MRWLVRRGDLAHDIAADIGRVPPPAVHPRDLTEAQVRATLAAAPDDRARLVVLAMVQMGLRCGDLARARVEDIDGSRRSLHVRAKGGRGEPTHWVPIPTEAWSALVDEIGARTTGPVVASCHDGSHLSAQWVGRIATRALLDTDLGRVGKVAALGVDEVLFARLGRWRTQAWSTSIVDVARGQLLDVIEGRSSVGLCEWLAERPQGWLDPKTRKDPRISPGVVRGEGGPRI